MLSRSRNASYTVVLILVFLVLMVVGTRFVALAQSDQFPEDLIIPTFSIISPQNNVTYQDQVPLIFVLTHCGWKPGSPEWETEHSVGATVCGYSLDGDGEVYVGENTTLTGLSAGAHQIVLHWCIGIDRTRFDYWTETVYFSVEVTPPFPTIPVAAVSAVLLAAVAVGVLVCFKKRKPKTLNVFSTRVWCFLKGTFRFRGTRYLVVVTAILLLVIVLALYFSTPPTGDWPMFHHDATHNGYSTSTAHSTSKAPNTKRIQWVYPAGDSQCSPTVVDDKIYTAAGPALCCLNATTGDLIWNYTRVNEWFNSPAVAYGKVYTAAYSSVYCLNATTGVFVWSYKTGDWITWSSPAVADGRVYIGSTDNKIYCLDAENGTFIWSYTTGYVVWSSPAVAYGKVYIGSFDSNVYCLNATTGALVWNYTTGNGLYYVHSSPAVVDGRVYVGSDDGKIYCLDSTTGALIWSYATGSCVESSPAVAYGRVYVGNDDQYVYCLNAANGAFIWNYWTSDWILSSPAVADGKVYVGSRDNKLYCLNADTGEFIWSYTAEWDVDSTPAIANDKVYVSTSNKIYAFG